MNNWVFNTLERSVAVPAVNSVLPPVSEAFTCYTFQQGLQWMETHVTSSCEGAAAYIQTLAEVVFAN